MLWLAGLMGLMAVGAVGVMDLSTGDDSDDDASTDETGARDTELVNAPIQPSDEETDSPEMPGNDTSAQDTLTLGPMTPTP